MDQGRRHVDFCQDVGFKEMGMEVGDESEAFFCRGARFQREDCSVGLEGIEGGGGGGVSLEAGFEEMESLLRGRGVSDGEC